MTSSSSDDVDLGGRHQPAVNHDTQLPVTGANQSTADGTKTPEEPADVEWRDLHESVKVRRTDTAVNMPAAAIYSSIYVTSCKYPSSGRSSTRAFGARCSAPRYSSCNSLSSGRSFISVRQVALSGCFVILSLPHAYMNDLDIDLDRNTPWVDGSACVKFGLDRPSRLAGHTEHRYRQTDRQTNKHNGFYYIDYKTNRPY